MNYLRIKSKIKKITDIRFHERKCICLFPSKKEKPVYIIRFFHGQGILSILYSACGQAFHARKLGMVPYVDMIHFKTQYHAKRNQNPWELFFSQPPEFTPKMLSFRVPKTLSRFSPPEEESENLFTQYDFCLYSQKKKIFDSLFTISSSITDSTAILEKELRIDDCIGVYARGTDYIALKPKNHHIQPTSVQLIEKCDEYIKKYDKKIFLVTEDSSIYADFVEHYGDRLVTIDEDIHFESYTSKIPLYKKIKPNNSIQVAQTYLKKILLLSKCEYLIGGKTSGSLWACIFNDEQYKEVFLFDYGRYS